MNVDTIIGSARKGDFSPSFLPTISCNTNDSNGKNNINNDILIKLLFIIIKLLSIYPLNSLA